MEFLIYALCAGSVGVVLTRPAWERWAFRMLIASFALSAILYLIAVSGSVVPGITL